MGDFENIPEHEVLPMGGQPGSVKDTRKSGVGAVRQRKPSSMVDSMELMLVASKLL